MTGKELKERLRRSGKSQSELAHLLGCTPQSLISVLSAADVKSGTIEKIAKVLNVPISFFYDTSPSPVLGHAAYASGDNAKATANGDITVQSPANQDERVKYLERIIAEKERLIALLMGKCAATLGGVGETHPSLKFTKVSTL